MFKVFPPKLLPCSKWHWPSRHTCVVILDFGVSQTRLRSVAGCAERREVCHPQWALQRGDEQRQLPRDQEQVSGPQVQGETSTRLSFEFSVWMFVCVSYLTEHVWSTCVSCTVTRAGARDRRAAAQGGLPEHDRGPGSPLHGPKHTFQWGGVSRRVPPASQQRVNVWKQACQCSAA